MSSRIALEPDLDAARRGVALPLVDQPARVRCDRVVDEDVEVVLGAEEGTDVAVEHEVGLDAPLDDLLDLRVGPVHQPTHGLGHLALPLGKRRDVRVDGRVALAPGHATMLTAPAPTVIAPGGGP